MTREKLREALLIAIDEGLADPIHQRELDKLQEAVRQLKSNRRSAPAGLPGPGECECPIHESHDGKCLGPYCYCH